MNERSKTNKEIYEQKYPHEKTQQNPMIGAEAIGYLKALIEYFPSEEEWAKKEMTSIMLYVIFHSL